MECPRQSRFFALLLVLATTVLAVCPCHSATDTDSIQVEALWSLDYGKTLARDVGYVFGAPLRWDVDDWSAFSLRAMTIFGTSALLDEPARDFAQRNRGDVSDWVSDRFDRFGMNYPTWIIGGFFLSGMIFDNNTAKMVALDGLAANLIETNLITPALKQAFGRHRPFLEDGGHTFEPFSEHDGFPSGHAIKAFVNAAVIAAHYEQWWVKAIAYGVAGLVAFARVNYDMHYVSDVLAGAAIGIAIGEGIVKVNKKARGF